MNINEKNRLWSKYYLVNMGGTGRFSHMAKVSSLAAFLDKEVEVFKLDGKSLKEKRKKMAKSMLRSLSRSQILCDYCSRLNRVKFTSLSKSKLIDKVSNII